MDGAPMTATVCTVAASRRCVEAPDGPHTRVAFAGGRWWRWHHVGMWTQSARVPGLDGGR